MSAAPDDITAGADDSDRRDDAVQIVRTLRDAGHVAYLAGGCVRDELLGLRPKDYDVATDATPDRVRQLFPRTQAVGAAFGVILVRQGRSVVEVATFRTDQEYTDGRRPSGVRFTTAEEDAQRRDFTINGLFLDPLQNDRVIDFVGGQEDLRARVLRAIGEPKQRFSEDYLRLLRAARFAARFGLSIDPATRSAVIDNAPKLAQISPERINDELRRMLTPAGTRVAAWELLADLRLLPVIFRFLPEREETAAKVATQSTATTAPMQLFPRVAPDREISPPLAYAAAGLCYRRRLAPGRPVRELLEPAEVKRLVAALRKALRFSNEDGDGIRQCLWFGQLLGDVSPTVATMKRFLAQPRNDEARALLAALAEVDGSVRSPHDWLRERLSELEKADFAPPPLVTGDDLVARGLQPGPIFKRVLEQAYDEQLEGRLTTKDAAIDFALRAAAPG